MQPLKILHLMSARYYVGEAARVLDLAESQIEKGHTAMLVVRQRHSVMREASHRGMSYLSANFSSGFHPIRDYCDVRLIRRILDEHEIDLLHVHRGKDHWLGAWALRGHRRKIPLVRTRHVLMPIRDHFANRWLYRRATTGIIAVSHAVHEVVRRDLPYFTGPMQVIQGGPLLRKLAGCQPEAGAELRTRLHIPDDMRVLTLLARVARVKGQVYAVEALQRILQRHPRTMLVLAYPRAGDYRREVEGRIQALGLRENVRWMGKEDRLGPIFAMTDIGLIASIGSEGWSRVAVEFFACGVPLVATSVGSLPEIVEEGKTGLLVLPGNPEAMADAVCALLGDPARVTKMSEAARATRDYYNHARMTDEAIGFYRDVLERFRT